MRKPLLALHRQNYKRCPELYLCSLFRERRWSPERLAPVVGEKKAVWLARELVVPPLWLYIDGELFSHYWTCEDAFEDMEIMGKDSAHLLSKPPKDRLADDFEQYLLDFV